MDLDAYVAAHRGDWDRLEELTRQRRLTGAEADEILDRYQRVATDLSLVRSTTPDPSLELALDEIPVPEGDLSDIGETQATIELMQDAGAL